jgi:hypothetical protein
MAHYDDESLHDESLQSSEGYDNASIGSENK